MTRTLALQTRYTLWRNTASVMKDLIGLSSHIAKIFFIGLNITQHGS